MEASSLVLMLNSNTATEFSRILITESNLKDLGISHLSLYSLVTVLPRLFRVRSGPRPTICCQRAPPLRH